MSLEAMSVALFAANVLDRGNQPYALNDQNPSRFYSPGQAERNLLKTRRAKNKSARASRRKNRK